MQIRANSVAVMLVLLMTAASCSSSGTDESAVVQDDSSDGSEQTDESQAAEAASDEPGAVEEAADEPAAEDEVEAPPTEVATTVSYSEHVHPVLESKCASCHTADGPGAAHLVLASADDAKSSALDIVGVTSVKYMPPWPAGDGDVAFHDDRRLTQDELDAIATWFDEGGTLDVEPETPITPTEQIVPELRGDAVMAGAPYKGSSATIDDFRCQIYDPELTEPAFLQAYQIEPDQTEVVHHSLVFRVRAAERERYETQDAGDEPPGWECTGGGLIGDGSSVQIMSWAPGQAPNVLPADTGIDMEPGDFFVAQIHYHYEPEWDDLPPDETRLVADFATEDDIAAAGGELTKVDLTLYLGPVEVPCAPEEEGPLCDRDLAQAEVSQRADPFTGRLSDFMNQSCGVDPDEIVAQPDGKALMTCDIPARPGEIVSIWAHMHEIGDVYTMTLNPGTPDEQILLDIPRWDFDWQLVYEPVEPIMLEPGDIIRVECGYDANLRPEGTQPRYVIWADGTEDEMCYSQIVTRPS